MCMWALFLDAVLGSKGVCGSSGHVENGGGSTNCPTSSGTAHVPWLLVSAPSFLKVPLTLCTSPGSLRY